MANFGVIAWDNAGDYLDTAVDRGDYYLIEAEGIYTGYRYYETRYADTVMGRGNADSEVGAFDSAAGWNYDEEVVYPFGYGLSYTTFSKTLESVDILDQGFLFDFFFKAVLRNRPSSYSTTAKLPSFSRAKV